MRPLAHLPSPRPRQQARHFLRVAVQLDRPSHALAGLSFPIWRFQRWGDRDRESELAFESALACWSTTTIRPRWAMGRALAARRWGRMLAELGGVDQPSRLYYALSCRSRGRPAA